MHGWYQRIVDDSLHLLTFLQQNPEQTPIPSFVVFAQPRYFLFHFHICAQPYTAIKKLRYWQTQAWCLKTKCVSLDIVVSFVSKNQFFCANFKASAKTSVTIFSRCEGNLHMHTNVPADVYFMHIRMHLSYMYIKTHTNKLIDDKRRDKEEERHICVIEKYTHSTAFLCPFLRCRILSSIYPLIYLSIWVCSSGDTTQTLMQWSKAVQQTHKSTWKSQKQVQLSPHVPENMFIHLVIYTFGSDTCVCMYTCLYIYTHTNAHTCTHTHTHTNICVRPQESKFRRLHIHIQSIYVYIYAFLYHKMCINMYTYIDIWI